MGLLYLLFQHTKIGLGMRAVATNPASARLVGIRVGWTLALGWGLAATVGAVSGIAGGPAAVPRAQHDGRRPDLRLRRGHPRSGSTARWARWSAAWSSASPRRSPGAYVGFIGSDLKVGVPLVIILCVLLLRPQGLFGRAAVERA